MTTAASAHLRKSGKTHMSKYGQRYIASRQNRVACLRHPALSGTVERETAAAGSQPIEVRDFPVEWAAYMWTFDQATWLLSYLLL